MNGSRRQQIRHLLDTAIAAVNGHIVVEQFLLANAHQFSEKVFVVSLGKASFAMASGAAAALGENIRAGLVVSKTGHLGSKRISGWQYYESGHPVPDQRSIEAGAHLIDFIQRLPPDGQLLFLLSGGTSSLVEVLPHNITFKDIQAINKWLIGSGWDIKNINDLRKCFSQIKGGKLLNFLKQRKIWNLVISDVPSDDPADVGSGLLMPPCNALSVDFTQLPNWISQKLQLVEKRNFNHLASETEIHTHVVATLNDALAAAAQCAKKFGYKVYQHDAYVNGDVFQIAQMIAEKLDSGPIGVYLWGGETTVQLPERPGRGGRNQMLALLIAQKIAGKQDVVFCSVGTDGTDGPTDDAGAMIDGDTVERGLSQGLDVVSALSGADAGRFLAATGDLIRTGPTGTNVMDIMIALKFK